MQQLGLKSPVRLKKYRSYRGNMGLAAENILQRQFKAEAPCEKWVTDITEFRAGGQKLYLSPILDLFNGVNATMFDRYLPFSCPLRYFRY